MPSIQVPGTAEVRIPLTLSIGSNRPNLYLGYGDSITKGDGSSDGKGYVAKLQVLLVGQLAEPRSTTGDGRATRARNPGRSRSCARRSAGTTPPTR